MNKILHATLVAFFGIFLIAHAGAQTFNVLCEKSVCAPETVDLTDPKITEGSDPCLVFSYWRDEHASIPLENPSRVTESNVYYIKATLPDGSCRGILPISVQINKGPELTICPPPPSCGEAHVDLTSTVAGFGTISGISYEFFYDEAQTHRILEPNHVKVTTNTNFYVKATFDCGCSSSACIPICISPLPELIVKNPAPVCGGEKVDLFKTITSYKDSDGLTYSFYADIELKIAIDPKSVTTSGTYYIKAVNDACCEIVKCVQVHIEPLPPLVVCDPKPVCDQPIDLKESVNGITEAEKLGYVFTYYSDAALTTQLTSSVVNTSGTYYVKENSSLGCSTSKPVVVVINDKPALTVKNPDPTCQLTTIDLFSTIVDPKGAPITYTYYADDELKNVLQTSEVNQSGTYYIKAQATEGCFAIKPVVISIGTTPLLEVANPAPVCSPETIDLSTTVVNKSADPSFIYSYYADAQAVTALPNSNVSTSGTYYIKLQNATGCFTIKPVIVSIGIAPSLNVTAPAPICGPATISLEASITNKQAFPDVVYSYYADADLKNAISGGQVSESGTYYIQAKSAEGCATVKSIVVSIGLPPTFTVLPPAPACAPATVNLASSVASNGSALTFSYYKDANLTQAIAGSEVSESGNYFIKATGSTGCSSVKPVTVVINRAPVLKINQPEATASVDLTRSEVTSGSDDGLTFAYYFDAEHTLRVPNPSQISTSGTYYIVATSPQGCKASGEVRLDMAPVSLFIPTLFTPNGDGLNDTFVIKGIEYYPNNSIVIYNRWGNKVYQTQGYGVGQKYWNGSGLLEGTYYYVLTVNSNSGAKKYSGWIELLLRPIHG